MRQVFPVFEALPEWVPNPGLSRPESMTRHEQRPHDSPEANLAKPPGSLAAPASDPSCQPRLLERREIDTAFQSTEQGPKRTEVGGTKPSVVVRKGRDMLLEID